MTSAVDIQIVNPPNLEKIQNFFKDATYRETIEFSANFNTRLCIERRLRLPFIDPQTGVAQNHSQLFMDRRQRLPPFREGQIYSYPAARWRKSRRQYLSKMYRYSERPFQALKRPEPGIETADSDFNGTLLEESSSLGGADTSDSKDSQQHLKEDLPKEWFYDEMDMNEMDALEEPKSPADDEYDYDPRYGNKKRRKRRPGKKAMLPHLTDTVRKGRPGAGASGRGRGRRKTPRESRNIDPPSPGLTSEPPSFESAAAAVSESVTGGDDSELRNYRKYL
ncbi:unnamed protein product [Hermetia illucens]|uniref:DPF1-3 N-terminal domain-containing protein n=1 Tax=Hermetia illucens TaxID=343691 RepID=A0A7R8V287_HERIL|nr:zinc finger protein DPF3 [Hermetia illucens]CAD7090762.1 unnamed protein product [Hermetia illucens]